jgi:hypothetical protein
VARNVSGVAVPPIVGKATKTAPTIRKEIEWKTSNIPYKLNVLIFILCTF